jgi:hypothetical protein
MGDPRCLQRHRLDAGRTVDRGLGKRKALAHRCVRRETNEYPFRIRDTRLTQSAIRFKIPVAPDKFDVRMLRDVCVSPQGDQVIYQALGYLYSKICQTVSPCA